VCKESVTTIDYGVSNCKCFQIILITPDNMSLCG